MKKPAPVPAYPELDAIGHRDGYPFAVGSMQASLQHYHHKVAVLARSRITTKEMRAELEKLAQEMRDDVTRRNTSIAGFVEQFRERET